MTTKTEERIKLFINESISNRIKEEENKIKKDAYGLVLIGVCIGAVLGLSGVLGTLIFIGGVIWFISRSVCTYNIGGFVKEDVISTITSGLKHLGGKRYPKLA